MSNYWLTRFWFQKALAFIYLIAFLIALNQFTALNGEHGLVPAAHFLEKFSFWDMPSIFFLHASDPFFRLVAGLGILLAVLALTGISEAFGMFFSVAVWFLLWALYSSFVNIGEVFYGFGWEIMTLEAGFLAIFLGSSKTEPPKIIIGFIRWMLFRTMFGAGLIKIRGDECWRDLTCLVYHYETQPLPNPLSWHFHHLPVFINKLGVAFNHFVELVAPWGYFAPPPVSWIAGGLTVLFQTILIFSGNLSFLNYLTIVLAIACFDDRFLSKLIPVKVPPTVPMSGLRKGVLKVLTGAIVLFSIPPVVNMFSPYQIMNTSFEPFHLVNTYGAFGSVGKTRPEIIIEGTEETVVAESTEWREYEFKAKPGDLKRTPPIVSPYHYRLDWLLWFAAMSDFRHYPWILNLTAKLLKNDPETLSLIKTNPFPGAPPKYIRAILYEYKFTSPGERKQTGAWWTRKYLREYLPALSLDNPQFQGLLQKAGWTE